MRKLYFSAIFFYLSILTSYAQTKPAASDDSSTYKARKLTFEEINFVSAYYHQNGNHSAVTGGVGTEKLTDFANTIDLQISRLTRGSNKNTFLFELGVDHYTSASSDKIDPFGTSSASRSDTRVYPSVNWTLSNPQTQNAIGFTASYSQEYDYQSFGGAMQLTRVSRDKNTEVNFKLQAFLDTWLVILPVELRPPGYGSGAQVDPRPVDHKPRNSFSASLSMTQVINQRFQASLTIEPTYQLGLLATKYQRDYFTDGSERVENLPATRYKFPVSARLSYFAGDHLLIRAFYRYYADNWGIKAQTAELELPVKVTSFFSLSPFFRYNNQLGTRYFNPYGLHNPKDLYYTSDYDLSTLTSGFVGLNLRLSPPKGVFGIPSLASLELRYGHYSRSNGLKSDIISLALKIK